MKQINYSVPMRTAIIYNPIGLMTSRNIYSCHNEYLLEMAADFIMDTYEVFNALYDTQKAVIHCGNIGKHGAIINETIKKTHTTIIHELGRLKETIEEFLDGDTQFLLVVSAEYGVDLKDIDLQFVLKVPFAAMDERMRALEKTIGESEFKQFYTMDALNRLVQQCGRVGRGADGFGITFILDEKFWSLYRKYRRKLPQWFLDRIIRQG